MTERHRVHAVVFDRYKQAFVCPLCEYERLRDFIHAGRMVTT